MVRSMLSFILVFIFTAASLGNCSEANCADEGSQKLTNVCSQSSHPEEPQSHDTDSEDSHCAFHCNHTVSASIPFSSVKLTIEVTKEAKANYFFAYQDPTLDSIERPPLSC